MFTSCINHNLKWFSNKKTGQGNKEFQWKYFKIKSKRFNFKQFQFSNEIHLKLNRRLSYAT